MTSKRRSPPRKKAVKPAAETPQAAWSTTAVHFPKATLQLLKLVAFHRAQRDGGRISVSKLVTDLVEARRADFEREISKVK